MQELEAEWLREKPRGIGHHGERWAAVDRAPEGHSSLDGAVCKRRCRLSALGPGGLSRARVIPAVWQGSPIKEQAEQGEEEGIRREAGSRGHQEAQAPKNTTKEGTTSPC